MLMVEAAVPCGVKFVLAACSTRRRAGVSLAGPRPRVGASGKSSGTSQIRWPVELRGGSDVEERWWPPKSSQCSPFLGQNGDRFLTRCKPFARGSRDERRTALRHVLASEVVTPVNPITVQLAEALVRGSGGRAEIMWDDQLHSLDIEEKSSTMVFVEAEGDEVRVVPFVGDAGAIQGRLYVVTVRPSSWLDGEQELVVTMAALAGSPHQDEVLGHLRAALDYWAGSSELLSVEPLPSAAPVGELPAHVDSSEVAPYEELEEDSPSGASTAVAQMRADVCSQWSWASSAARIPQISALTIAVSEPVEHARISVRVSDDDVQFGFNVAYEGALPAGTTVLNNVHVPLSARVMSQVDERRGAACLITLEDVGTARVVARVDEAIDIQPRDLWLSKGDPRRGEQQERMIRRFNELVGALQEDPERSDADGIVAELEQLRQVLENEPKRTEILSRSLLASFVRPNHPEVAVLAREAATLRGRATGGDASFHAFQIPDIAEAEKAVDASVTAIYEALQCRGIAYSEPPPGWDYESKGQRIRDHGDVARGGLGTCMDTTVLMAAVVEQVGLHPVLVLIPGHIFVGYWRRDPLPERRPTPEWYPNAPFFTNASTIRSLVEGGWLGVIETTTFTVGKDVSAANARGIAQHDNLLRGLREGLVALVDVVAARREGVSPLPALNERADGVTEVVEYRPGGGSTVTRLVQEPADIALRERQVDSHPARYRTWKSALFSLNATNALLNLGNNPRVQPLMIPPEALGFVEDKLNQDVSFSLHSGHDTPEVWKARGVDNAMQLLGSGDSDDRQELVGHINDRRIYVQRIGRSGGRLTELSKATFFREIRSMTHNAKSAREERGMNPLFLCLGLLRWPYKPGVFAEAPLILVPVNVTVARGRQDFTLSLDATQRTTPNAALIEWLRREHGLSIPGLTEPLADRAGIDVDGVLAEVRKAVAERGLAFDVAAEARLATLDLSAFRMWQDMNVHAETFIDRPLIRHLIETPTEQFEDPAIMAAGPVASEDVMAEELEVLDTPIPADSTQKRAVLWARQGRTFVLQGPPGTGKSQTITNIVAECIMSGQRVLFVAEKGTALAVVQRRLDAIGLGPFTLNLHHEGSNATEVRAQLRRALSASVTPDPTAMESARRRLRNARFELMQYPQHLHEPNAAGFSAYSAHDQLMVLGEGPALTVPTLLVAHEAEKVTALRELFQGLQPWAAAAGVRPDHPWRLAGAGDGDPFDLLTVSHAVTGVLDGTAWAATMTGPLREALDQVTHPSQLQSLAAAANRVLPSGDDLSGVLNSRWTTAAPEMLSTCARAIDGWAAKLHGFAPDIVRMNLRGIAGQLQDATASSMLGRARRQATAIAPLAAVAPTGLNLQPANAAAAILSDLIAAQDAGESVRASISSVPGLGAVVPSNPFQPGALQPVGQRLDELFRATAGLRDGGEWGQRVQALATAGQLSAFENALSGFAQAWHQLLKSLAVSEADLRVWRGGRTLLAATEAVSETWRREVGFERLLPLQHWCSLVRKLEPLRAAGLPSVRDELLDGSLAAYVAEDALARGVAQASLDERVSAAGLDRFNSLAHDQRVTSYSEAQSEVRKHWVTEGPATLLERRGGGGAGKHTGGLARELEKTTHKLGTRPILRKYGEAVQELTPLVLCSPSSVVDLIEPGVMEFDVVIFDEASQITVPEAVGALGRARAAIVVGDSKQMPPTRRVGGGSTDEEEVDNPDAVEIVEDQESILSECELARVPTLRLNWHYRSQDEALIAFSNRAYYRGDLSSFPTPTLLSSETGVQFRRVHGPADDKGMYLRAGSARVSLGNGISAGANTNPVEAVEIVRYVEELLHRRDRLPSLGIVTFNEQQRDLISELLQASPDTKVAAVMDDDKMGRGESLFVKALEQVQGDERDTVIFSVAFSKQANNKIPTNFGPLSNSGGERRLNVAVTRARRRNIVFCSFDPSDLVVDGSTYDGPKHLKEFLTFAKDSGAARDLGETAHRIAIRDRHRDHIADALREAGLHVMSDVGLSNFRIDLVLARTADPTRPILPVLLDGESWRKRTTVSDRDVLPVEVLENLMGWPAVARIWWPMWLQNRQEVIDRILSEVDLAEAKLGQITEPSGPALEPALEASAGLSILTPTLDPAIGILASRVSAVTAEPPSKRADSSDLASAPLPTPTPPIIDGRIYRPRRVADEPIPEDADLTAPPSPAPAHGAAPRDPDPRDLRVAEFVPAHTDSVGSKDVLDALPDRKAAAMVREQVVDVIEAEGPVEVARLTRIVARRFGLYAVRAARAEDIAKLIPRGQLRKGRLGAFAWPSDLDPTTWTGFRAVDPNASRTLDEVAPEEIANAMRAVLAERPTSGEDDVLRRTAELFGIVRLGANVRSRLQAVYAKLPTEPSAP